jgi:hypothetical protein
MKSISVKFFAVARVPHVSKTIFKTYALYMTKERAGCMAGMPVQLFRVMDL